MRQGVDGEGRVGGSGVHGGGGCDGEGEASDAAGPRSREAMKGLCMDFGMEG